MLVANPGYGEYTIYAGSELTMLLYGSLLCSYYLAIYSDILYRSCIAFINIIIIGYIGSVISSSH